MAETGGVTIPNVAIRIVKESGVTEVFVTSKDPLMNWSTHLKGDAPLKSGAYDIIFVPVKEAPEPPPTEAKHVEGDTKVVGTAGTQTPAPAPAEAAAKAPAQS